MGNVNIANFGLVAKKEESRICRKICGTPGFIAPEVWNRNPQWIKVDYYALGIVLFMLVNSGEKPYWCEWWQLCPQPFVSVDKAHLINKPITIHSGKHRPWCRRRRCASSGIWTHGPRFAGPVCRPLSYEGLLANPDLYWFLNVKEFWYSGIWYQLLFFEKRRRCLFVWVNAGAKIWWYIRYVPFRCQ